VPVLGECARELRTSIYDWRRLLVVLGRAPVPILHDVPDNLERPKGFVAVTEAPVGFNVTLLRFANQSIFRLRGSLQTFVAGFALLVPPNSAFGLAGLNAAPSWV
jgi:hypothetical protein